MTSASASPRRARPRWRRRLAGALSALLPLALGGLVVWALNGSAPVERLRHLVFDQYQRWSPRAWSPDLPVRVVAIDDETLARVGQWPWPRARVAELTEKLAQNGAAVIAFDVLFSEEDRLSARAVIAHLPPSPERDALEKALASQANADPLRDAFRAATVVAALALNDGAVPAWLTMKSNFVIAGDNPAPALARFSGILAPLPALAEAAAGLGAIHYIPDQDLIVRRVPMLFAAGPANNAVLVPALSLEALRLAQGGVSAGVTPIVKSTNASGEKTLGGPVAVVAMKIGDFEIPLEHDGALRIHYAGTQAGRTLPAWRVFDGSIPRADIEGRIILVGMTASSMIDLRSTPLETRIAGVDVHAEAIEHIISGARLSRPDWAPGAEALLILAGGVLLVWMARRFRPLVAAFGAAAAIGGMALASWFAFRHAELLLDPLIPGVSWLTAWLATTVGVYRRTEREKRVVRDAFTRYLAPAMVERIAADPEALRLGGETRNVTVMFCDVRDFTSRAEALDAAGVVGFLNAVHTPMTQAVLAQGGTIDKYIGDGLMAFWNAPLDTPDHAERACLAALAMIDAVPQIDARLRMQAQSAGRAHQPLRVGVGLNTGDAFVGNMGSDQRFDYSIVGDPVNVAARLETASKEFGAPIVVSAATRAAAPAMRFLALGHADLKGKSAAVDVFALHPGRKGDDDEAAFDRFQALHDAAREAVAARQSDARDRLAAVRANPMADRYARYYDMLEARLGA